MSSSSPPAHAEAILRVTSYHRRDFDMAVTWFPPREHAPVQTSLTSTSRDSTVSLGLLDRLPLELINAMCLELDVSSLFAFRHVNLRAQQVVNSLREYRIAVNHSLNCICAMLRTGVASFVTLSAYYSRLCERNCAICGDNYGDLIHLLNWTRCCSVCLRDEVAQVRVLVSSAARKVLQLSSKSLRMIPTLQTLPGIYSMEERAYKGRRTIMTAESAFPAFRSKNGGAQVPRDALKPKSAFAFMACCAFPNYDPGTGRVQYGISCAGCQLAVEQPAGTLGPAGPLRDLVYCQESFLKHFATCEQAQLLWTLSKEGCIEPPDFPYGCKLGGYFNLRS